ETQRLSIVTGKIIALNVLTLLVVQGAGTEFLFFKSFGDLRVLHSFPTRRSSDLWSFDGKRAKAPLLHIDYTPPDFPPVAKLAVRSEEHTSELQSRSDLVCRLLLEKKTD